LEMRNVASGDAPSTSDAYDSASKTIRQSLSQLSLSALDNSNSQTITLPRAAPVGGEITSPFAHKLT
jgi:hypothetical protein